MFKRLKAIHVALVAILCVAVAPVIASTFTQNGTLIMAGNGDTWAGLSNKPANPIHVVSYQLTSGGGNVQYRVRYGITTTGAPIFNRSHNGTNGTTSTTELAYGAGGWVLPWTGVELDTNDASATGTITLQTDYNK